LSEQAIRLEPIEVEASAYAVSRIAPERPRSVNGPTPIGAPRSALKKPSHLLLFSEWRWMVEFGASLAAVPALFGAKRGDGHAVLVIPGFLAGDLSTDMLRRFLTFLGYRTYGWELGHNYGGVYGMRAKLRARLLDIAERSSGRVSIVGWSLGGVYARDLALSVPDRVRYVITMGSPFANDISATNAGRLYELLSGESVASAAADELDKLAGPLPMPTTSFYTKTDGIVNWRTCLVDESKRAENVEVLASHIGLGVNPAVLWAVSDRLAQADGKFSAFDRGGPFTLAYPRPTLRSVE
jgi:pimeloyl-ACP methyl ester carboxylesterase